MIYDLLKNSLENPTKPFFEIYYLLCVLLKATTMQRLNCSPLYYTSEKEQHRGFE